MKKKLAGAGLVAVLALIYFVSPYWTIHQIRAAAEAGEGDRLAHYVDFPSVRESLKAQLLVRMNKQNGSLKDNPFAGLGQLLAVAMVGPLIDTMVTPDSLAMMLSRGKGLERKPTPEPSTSAGVEHRSNDADRGRVELTQGYEGMDVFKASVRLADQPEPAITFVLNRIGAFSWKLTAIRIRDL